MKLRKRMIGAFILVLALALCAAHIFSPGNSEGQTAEEYAALPSPAPTPQPQDRILGIMEGMTAEQKAWQMIMVYPEDITGSPTVTDLEVLADALNRCPVGGFCIDGENMESEQQLLSLTQNIRSASNIGAFIGVDEEGGKVARLSYSLGVTTDFLAMYTYREEGEVTAYENAETIGSDLVSFGFNLNFAPVADVWTNPENTVIAERAYSTDAGEAARLVAQAVNGYRDAGVIATLKHFPGHGNTAEDSHYSSARSGKTLEELRQCEFLPFYSGIEAGAGMIMTAHIILTEIDPNSPATLSGEIITKLLRGELGWEGVVITDSFRMDALAEYNEREAVIAAVEAGCDIILCPYDPSAAVQAILEGIPPERIDESVYRILSLKMESGIIN